MNSSPVIVWFRLDLRLGDHPALSSAAGEGRPILPVYIDAPGDEGSWAPGAGSRAWLRASLEALEGELRRKGSRLIVRSGPAVEAMARLAEETGAGAVAWNERFEPAAPEVSGGLRRFLESQGIEVRVFPASWLYGPNEILTGQGTPYRVFTPFSRACLAAGDPPPPLPAPRRWKSPETWPASESIDSLFAEEAGALKLPKEFAPGARGARRRLERFLGEGIADYAEARDRIDEEGTSGLAAHLHFGEISGREAWHAVSERTQGAGPGASKNAWAFLRQLLWREFAALTLAEYPAMADEPIDESFRNFTWRRDARAFEAWKEGRTGYPLVDAAMRELAATGCMHNRLRMVTASFLSKHLLLPWTLGERWFWEKLLDADLANNAFGWQWVAGCGRDAAPFIRVFNPVAQGERFDPKGDYVRRWIPELAGLGAKWIHQPWAAPEKELAGAGIRLGRDYPEPIVNHREARERALMAFEGRRGRGL